MKRKKLGVITLAVTLISLGILLLLNNFTDVDIYRTFSIMWPCIIILFGLEIIITRLIYKKKSEDVYISFDTISIVLLIIIVVASSVIASVGMAFSGFNFIKDGISISHSFNVFYKYDSEFKKNYTLESSGKDGIEVINSFGDVEVYSSDSDKIEVDAKISFKHNDEELAKKFSNNIIKIDESDGTIKIVSDIDKLQQARDDRIGDINVNYNIKVPDTMLVNVKNKFGNVTVDGIGKDTKISNSHGNVDARVINGMLSLENSFGNVDINKISKNASVRNKHGNVNTNNIGGDLTLSNAFGNINVMDVGGSAEIENSHDSIVVKKVAEDVKIKGKYGNIETEDITGELTIENSNGNIRVERIADKANIVSRFGNIDISEVNKYLKIVSNNGNINYSTSNTIELGMDISNEFGDINIDLPSTQKGFFDIITEYGDINDKFGFTIKERINEQRINESIGNDEVRIEVRNRNGDIRILAN